MMDFRDTLKAYAEKKNWKFVYARRDYQNLMDATDFIADELEGYGIGETMLFVDPIVRTGTKMGIRFTGHFMVLTKSDLDDNYENRVEKYIDPVLDILFGGMKDSIICDFDIDQWKTTEMINQFDWNADGVMVSYNVKNYG